MKKCQNIGCHNEIQDKRTYCSLTCRNIYVNKHMRDYDKNAAGISKENQYLKNPKTCIACSAIIEYKKKRNNFCSKNCSATVNNTGRIHSQKTKEKIRKTTSKSIIEKWKDPEYAKKSFVSAGKRRFTSKGELEVRNYFINKFPEHEWTFGVFFNVGSGRISSVDLYSKKLKICIEYDGIWHFKDINGQLKKKQLKDDMLNKWCQDNGYRMLRISEEFYKKDKSLSLIKLEKEILDGKRKLVKFF